MNAEAYDFLIEEERQEQQMRQKRQMRRKKSPRGELAKEDVFILATIEKLQKDLVIIRRSLDAVTDQDLIDSFIFELNAINMRYKFYIQMCKEKGLVGAIF